MRRAIVALVSGICLDRSGRSFREPLRSLQLLRRRLVATGRKP